MTKAAEKKYFKSIGQEGLDFSLRKPFSDLPNLGALLSNMAAIFTVISNKFDNETIDIVDIGCGSGWTSYFLARAGYRVSGVDISKDAIAAAKKYFCSDMSNLGFMSGDFEKLSSRLTDFNVALFIDSLHHADNQLTALKSAHKALKSGGICIICEPGRGHSKAPDAIRAKQDYGVNENDVVPREIVKKAKKAGFKKVEILPYPPTIHKVAYKKFSQQSLKSRVLNNLAARVLIMAHLQLFRRKTEGLIVLYK